MRIRRRYVVLAFASVAAFALGGTATAVASTSTLPTWNVTPSVLPPPPPSPATAPVALDVRTSSVFAPSSQKLKTLTLLFDDDIVINLAGIPSCTTTFPSSAELSTAWNTCGPGAPAAKNAYLSPNTAVSGTASTAPPSNFSACVLVFKKSATSLLLFAEVNTVGAFSCSGPASNNAGETSVTLTGNLGTAGVADFGTKLTVPNIDQLPLPLDDFKAKVKRASVFKARCRDTNKLLNLRGTFVYTPAEPTDTVNKTKACT